MADSIGGIEVVVGMAVAVADASERREMEVGCNREVVVAVDDDKVALAMMDGTLETAVAI